MKDVAIIGGGAAGLSAALYAARGGLSVQVFDEMGGGGQLTEIAEIENYLGVGRISGAALAAECLKEAKAAGAEMLSRKVVRVERRALSFSLITTDGRGEPIAFEARTVILSNGARPRRLSVRGEREFLGHGVSYCAVCDGRFFGGKTVTVIGGGNGAFAEALYLSRIAAAVHIVHRSGQFRGERALHERLLALPNVIFHPDRQVRAISGDKCVEAVELRTREGISETLRTDGVFIAIGREPENAPFLPLFPQDGQGYVITDETCACATQGLFAAGDTRSKSLRQLSTAVADGANAAEGARRYLAERAFVPTGSRG
ncbi:MAG: FAD-dependent oxidoreductase [Clostridia bacterium]|nr:FAD-dependent oxidoreductase [Clostridia bacterium]